MDTEVIIEFTPAEETIVNDALSAIEGVIMIKGNSLNPGQRQALRKEGTLTEGYVNGVHGGLEATPESIPENFSMADFDRDILAKAVMLGFSNRMAIIEERLSDDRMIMGHQNIRHADGGLKILKLAAEGNASVSTILQNILNPRKHTTKHVVIVTIPPSGSTFTDGGLKGKHVTNFGKTVLSLTENQMTTGAVLVGPGDSYEIPATWKGVTITNVSATLPGSYTLTA